MILERAIKLTEERFEKDYKPIVLVALSGGVTEYRRRPLRLYKDEGGLYVRLDKRGQNKKYLREMAGARIVDVELKLAVFYELSH